MASFNAGLLLAGSLPNLLNRKQALIKAHSYSPLLAQAVK